MIRAKIKNSDWEIIEVNLNNLSSNKNHCYFIKNFKISTLENKRIRWLWNIDLLWCLLDTY